MLSGAAPRLCRPLRPRPRRRWRAGHWAAGLVVLLALPATAVVAPADDGTAGAFGFSPGDMRRVEQGEIVARGWPAAGAAADPGTIAAAVAMQLPAPPAAVIAHLDAGLGVAADPALLRHGRIDAAAGATGDGPDDGGGAWPRLAFPDTDDEGERAGLVAAGADRRFNLSAGEWADLAAAAAAAVADPAAAVDLAADAYRGFLVARYRDYRDGGTDAIAPYVRDGRQRSPAADLARSTAWLRARLSAELAPVLGRLQGEPPAPGTVERFYWKTARVDGRPTVMLLHVVARPTAAGLAFAVREFYVGHSYDTLQQAGLVRDAGGRTTMLLVNITTTPRVAGVLAPLARPIAERFLAQALAAYFASLRDRAAAQPG